MRGAALARPRPLSVDALTVPDLASGRAVSPKSVLARADPTRRAATRARCAQPGETRHGADSPPVKAVVSRGHTRGPADADEFRAFTQVSGASATADRCCLDSFDDAPKNVVMTSATSRRSQLCVVLIFATLVSACASTREQPPARTAGQCVEKGAKTGFAGAKTGVVTGVEGVKAAGKAVGGFVEGGSDQASREWKQGKAETRRAARSGSDETRSEAHAPNCR